MVTGSLVFRSAELRGCAGFSYEQSWVSLVVNFQWADARWFPLPGCIAIGLHAES
jgi:hypothetical protein